MSSIPDARPPAAVDPSAAPAAADGGHLQRHLDNRHIQLIAIGGAIGTGLFMGSGKTIAAAGPSILIVYALVGVLLFFVMRAMGELLLHRLEYKSFQDFAADLLGPWAGFFCGWTYWLCWIVTGMAEIIAVVGYWDYWVSGREAVAQAGHKPALWSLLLAVVTLAVLLFLNSLTVRLFGELEFWFALIKVVAIIALIVLGIWMLASHHANPDGTHSSIANLWNDGGIFPKGATGFFAGFQIATFAFVGIELVGTTAAETKDPYRSLPKAINQIPIRIILFYVGALLVIMTVTPWRVVNPAVSPFVNLFTLAGLGAAGSVMNFVVLTSASSSCNSGIYSTSRMLYGLAHKRMAPQRLGRLSSRQVPQQGLFISVVFILASLLLLLSDSIMGAFTLVTTISAILFVFVWSLILASYIVYRRRRPEAHATSTYKMPGGVVMCWVTLVFFVGFLVLLTFESDTRTALLWTPLWFIGLFVAWRVIGRRATDDDSPALGTGVAR